MKPFSLLIKPASADCNMRCDYCFYLGHSSFYPEEKTHRMTPEILETLVGSYMRMPQPEYAFIWQGGEPTLMGYDFFARAVELQIEYGRKNSSVVANALQTNGLLIDDRFAELFSRYRFLVGLSIDGPREIHNVYRHKAGGGGSHDDVVRAAETLKKHEVAFNALTLVSRANARAAADVYRYLVGLDILYHQYIPCVESDENGRPTPFSVSGEEWGGFMCGVFDAWYESDTRRVSVRLFDSVLNLLVDNRRTVCHMQDDCRRYFVVEYTGDVYPCDFFVEQDLKLGNIAEDTWASMLESEIYRGFGGRKKMWNPECDTCEWLWVCAGDCLKNRIPGADGYPRSMSRLCGGWKQFFEHTMPRFRELAEEVRRDRRKNAEAAVASGAKNVGRNDPCPCGSGRKYKKCCGAPGR